MYVCVMYIFCVHVFPVAIAQEDQTLILNIQLSLIQDMR